MEQEIRFCTTEVEALVPARTSAGVVFEDRGEFALKGIGDAVRVYAVRMQKDGA